MSKDTLKKILKQQSHSSLAIKVELKNFNVEDYLLVDVRVPHLYQTTPHIKNSHNIHDLEELKNFCHKHHRKKILLVCNGGLESAKYGTLLVQEGLDNIYFLDEYLQIIEEHVPLIYPHKEEK